MTVQVPDDLAGFVAAAITAGMVGAVRAERDGGDVVPSYRLTLLADQLRHADDGMSARGHDSGHADRYVSTIETADLLGVTERTVRRWCVSGRLPAVRAGTAWLIFREGIL